MVSLSQGNVSDFWCVGDSVNQPVCIEAQPQVGNVLQLGQGSGSLCYRFAQHQVGQHVGLCVPTNFPRSASAAEDKAVRSENLVGSSLMAPQALVPRAARPFGGHPSTLPTQTEAVAAEPKCNFYWNRGIIATT